MAKDELLEQDELEEVEEETETEEVEEKKQEKLTWKVSNKQFNDYTEECIANPIKKYLDELAAIDPSFAKCYYSEERNFDECMIFVINRAFSKRESSDEICYRNAREYYMGEIKPEEYTKKLYDNVSMPQQPKVELTEEEKKELKEKAKEEYKKEQIRKLEEKQAKEEAKQKELEAKKKEEEKAALEEAKKKGAFEQTSIFDFI